MKIDKNTSARIGKLAKNLRLLLQTTDDKFSDRDDYLEAYPDVYARDRE